MSYGEMYDYLKLMGFTFLFEPITGFEFSTAHVYYENIEVGQLCEYYAMFNDGKGMACQFRYDWTPKNEVEEIVKNIIVLIKQMKIREMLTDLKSDFE